LEHVCKRYGKHDVVRDFSCRILRGDKVGLIGPNGAGKTTLLKLILGDLAPDSGSVRLGSKLNLAYFDQFRTALDENAAVADVISQGADYVEINGRRKHVMTYLADFLFSAERARSPVRSLSGGERNRLLLARLFSRPANVIVLDEPTNDLDIETLELLEDLLAEFEGTLFLVSHDREFLDNVVTQVIAAEGAGRWREYVGGYSDWQASRQAQETATPPSVGVRTTSGARKPVAAAAAPIGRQRLSYKETHELAGLPARIEELEAEHESVAAQLADPVIYREAPENVAQLKTRLSALERDIDVATARWEELERRAAAAG
jgi:ATP-binding cassette subfamily F protein uup